MSCHVLPYLAVPCHAVDHSSHPHYFRSSQSAIKSATVGAGSPVGLSYLLLSGSSWQHDPAIGVHAVGAGAQMQQPQQPPQPQQPQQHQPQPHQQHQPQQHQQPLQPLNLPSQARAGPADSQRRGSIVTEELKELAELHREGVLDDEEFKVAKAKVSQASTRTYSYTRR